MERVLVSKLVVGDKDAFSVIFSAYYRDLVLFAVNIVHDVDNAEEIVQDNFVRIWEDRKDLHITTSLKSYMLRSVQNRCIDWYRHKKVRQAHIDEVSSNPELFVSDTDSYLFRSELEIRIKKILSVIPSDYSEAFRMNREEGLKYTEIAEKLNVSVRTIEVRVSKALHLLREHLKDYLP